jgi:hypothetical protein
MKHITALWALLCCAVVAAPLHAQSITKCQDAEGKWHYGTYASEKCGDGPVTEMRDSGVVLEVREAPPSIEELQAEKERVRAAQAELIEREEKRRIDRQLLEKYPSEQVILDLRNQRIAELEKQLEFNQGQLLQLKGEFEALGEPANDVDRQEAHELEQLIGRFERAIDRGQEGLETTRSDYGKLLERYRLIERDQ